MGIETDSYIKVVSNEQKNMPLNELKFGQVAIITESLFDGLIGYIVTRVHPNLHGSVISLYNNACLVNLFCSENDEHYHKCRILPVGTKLEITV